MIIKDFFWLWGSSDRQRASSAVHPFFFVSGTYVAFYSSVASQVVRPRPTTLLQYKTVLNSVQKATVTKEFASTPQAKAPVAWGLATPLAFWVRSATFCPHPTMSGRLSEERQRRRAVDAVWRLKMKGISRILIQFSFS
jgi:hypothetical protein